MDSCPRLTRDHADSDDLGSAAHLAVHVAAAQTDVEAVEDVTCSCCSCCYASARSREVILSAQTVLKSPWVVEET